MLGSAHGHPAQKAVMHGHVRVLSEHHAASCVTIALLRTLA